MKTILHTADIRLASPERVFEALTTEDGLAGWWTTSVRAADSVGGIIRFRFGETFNPEMQITELERPSLVSWRCVRGHGPWTDNTFRFSIEPRGEGTILFFRQVYAQELDDEEYGRYNYNWGYYLESLRLLVETGTGKPYQSDARA